MRDGRRSTVHERRNQVLSYEHYERNCSLPYLSTALTLEKIDCYSPLFPFTSLYGGVFRRRDDVPDECRDFFLSLTNGDMSQGSDTKTEERSRLYGLRAEWLPAFVACGRF